MNRRDIIKKAVLFPFIGAATAKAEKTKQKIFLDDIIDQIIFDRTFDDYLKSIQRIFEIIFKLPVGIHKLFTGDYAIIYVFFGNVEQHIIKMDKFCFDDLSLDERIEYTKSVLKHQFSFIKNRHKLYSKINANYVIT